MVCRVCVAEPHEAPQADQLDAAVQGTAVAEAAPVA
jgi:hypothetical protein